MKKIAIVFLATSVLAVPAIAADNVSTTANDVIAPTSAPVATTDATPVVAPANSSSAPAIATNPSTTEQAAEIAPVVTTDKGFYTTADLGLVRYTDAASFYDGSALPNPYALSLAGGYRYNRHVAAEASYSFIGDSILNSTGSVALTETLKASVLHEAAVGTYTINSKFDVFGKLGLANTEYKYSYSTITSVPASGSGTSTKTNLMFGLGGSYKINNRYSVRVQYENFGSTTLSRTFSNGTVSESNIGISLFSVGGTYNF